MNDDWKRKYYFDDKTRVTESPMPNNMPSNVSPFIKRDDYKEQELEKPKKSGRKKDCVIS